MYRWILSQKLLLGGFKWVKETSQFNKNFIKSYNDDGDEGCFLEIDVQYSETTHSLHNDLYFLLERMKIEKIEKLVGKLSNFKTSIKSWINIEKVHRVIKFNQKA